MHTGIDSMRLMHNQIYEEEYDSLVKGLGNLAELPIIIDDTPASELTPTRIRSVLRRIQSEKGELSLVVLDYIQKLGDRGAINLAGIIGKYSGACKDIAKMFNVPFVALAQINRGVESQSNKPPSIALGGAQRNLSVKIISNFEVSVPPLPTQQKIASILSAYDDLIENNTRRIKILETMAQTLYQEWFVKFRFPGHEQVQMVESELGLIPEGWLGKLEDALILQRGFDLPIKKRKQGNVPVYASTGITGTHNEAKIKAPGVVTGRSASLGTVKYNFVG